MMLEAKSAETGVKNENMKMIKKCIHAILTV
jgi:hypothetical protein